MTTITLNTDGTVSHIGDLPFELPMANPVRRRASTIRPVRADKRLAFVILRLVAGDTGRIAAFTRTWSGPWACVILATGQTETFNTRAEAITWEIELLNQ